MASITKAKAAAAAAAKFCVNVPSSTEKIQKSPPRFAEPLIEPSK